MKKTFIILVLLISAAMGVQAQSLVGTWKGVTETDDDGDKTTMFYVFKLGNKVDMKMLFETEDDEIGKMEFAYSMPGTYTRNGQEMTVHFDPKQSKAKLEKIVFTAELVEEFKTNPEMKDLVLDMLQEEINKEMKKQFENETSYDGDLTIKQLTATKLVIEDGDETLSFTRSR